jgi:ABC-type dipeptide/oligopeptide/nickel transport system permease component
MNLGFILRRLVGMLAVLVLMVYALNGLLDVAQGSFLEQRRADFGTSAADIEAYEQFEKSFITDKGLDENFWKRSGAQIRDLLRGDLGVSYQDPERKVAHLLAERLPATLILVLGSLGLAIVIGVPLGLWAAWKRDSFWDYALMGGSSLGLALPAFVLGVLGMFVFAVQVRLWDLGGVRLLAWTALPAGGWGGIQHLILPILALALGPMAILARHTRAAGVELLGSLYVRTAMAKGLGPNRILYRHILPLAWVQVLAVLGTLFGQLVVGTVLVEQLFRIPGIGPVLIDGILQRDTPVVVFATLGLVSLVMFFNLWMDWLALQADPRMQGDG